MKQNGDHPLRYHIYNLCFANFLLGRHPHGPGEFLFGPFEGSTNYSTMFPIDYSALNTPPETMEPYSPNKQSNRRSVVVWCHNDNIQTVKWSWSVTFYSQNLINIFNPQGISLCLQVASSTHMKYCCCITIIIKYVQMNCDEHTIS